MIIKLEHTLGKIAVAFGIPYLVRLAPIPRRKGPKAVEVKLPVAVVEVVNRTFSRKDQELGRIVALIELGRIFRADGRGAPLSTKLIDEAVGNRVRLRLVALLRELIKLSFITCDGSYCCTGTRQNRRSKRYVACDQYSKCNESGCGIALVIVCSADVMWYDDRCRKAAAKLGWDCYGLDMTDVLAGAFDRVDASGLDPAFVMSSLLGRPPRRKGETSEDHAKSVTRAVQRFQAGVSHGGFRLNGRCYHVLVNLPKDLRRKLSMVLADGEVRPSVEVDVHAMFWAILVSDMVHGPERTRLVEALSTGSFYRVLHECLASNGGRGLDGLEPGSGQSKFLLNAFVLFATPQSKQLASLGRALEASLPELAAVIRRIYTNRTPREVSRLFSGTEGQITLDRVLARLYRRGVAAIPYHDSVLVADVDAEVAIAEFSRACREVLGFAPLIRSKTATVTSDDLEYGDHEVSYDDSDLICV